MIGIGLGLLFGALALYLLIRFVRSITGEGNIAVWMLIVQPLCLLAGLGLTALLAPNSLAGCGITMAAVLIAGSVTFVLIKRRQPQPKQNDSSEPK
ncbi:MAG: hypothetical protein PHO41_10435 [Eubacteriales bacterium]|nr:hypothetical protein [Eubacteriales bacterium]